MNTLLLLIPAALFLGLVGLGAFLWAMKSGQFDDLDGAANRILFDDDDMLPPQDKNNKEAPSDSGDKRADPVVRRDRLREIGHLALPIVGAMVSQNLLNLIDAAMVGVLGPTALAAVGLSSYATFLVVAVVTGLSPAVQAVAARRRGEGRADETAVPLNGGLILALVIGLPLAVVLSAAAPAIMDILSDDPALVDQAVPYYGARLVGVVAVGMNFAFRGYWNGVNRSGVYLRVLLTIHACNVVLNYLLIFGKFGFPELGVAGAGWGTTIALYIGTAVYWIHGWRRARPAGFLARPPRRDQMATLVRLALPSMVQQLLFAGGLTAMLVLMGRTGTANLAAATVVLNLLLVAILPGLALGMAATSLVGHALGRGEPADARNWGWEVTRVAAAALAAIGLVAVAVPDVLLAGFLHDPAVVAVARPVLRLAGLLVAPDAVGLVLMHALLGAGAARSVMVVSTLTLWGVSLPLVWVTGHVMGWGLPAMWLGFAAGRVVQAGVFAALWAKGDWAAARV